MTAPMEAEPKPADVERRDPSTANQHRRTIFSVPVTVTVSIGQARLSVSAARVDCSADVSHRGPGRPDDR